MPDDPFDLSRSQLVPAHPKPKRELLFEFRIGHRVVGCELVYVGEWGVEARFVEDDGHVGLSHRFPTRTLAVEWAEEEWQGVEASDEQI